MDENTKLLVKISNDVAAIKQSQTDMYRELAGRNGRITKIENKQSRDDWRQWIHSVAIIPIVVAINAYLRKIGVQV